MNLRNVQAMRQLSMLVAVFSVLLASCGQTPPPGAGASGEDSRPAPSGDASAEEVAEESRGDVDCPADIDTPPRAATAPVDDIVGVRPGLTYEEATNVVLCTNNLLVATGPVTRGFNIDTFGATLRQGFSARFAEPRVVKSSKQIMQEMQDDFAARSGNAVREDMKPGQSRWYVSTMGLPGQERVIAAAREEWFAEGRNPTMQSVADALIKKYGPPSRHQVAPHVISLVWTRDPQGRMAPMNSPLANSCVAMSSPNGGSNFSPECGLVVAAMIWPMRENAALAQRFEAGVADQANGYQLIVNTEKELGVQEAAKRQRQVEDATQNADRPQL